MPPKSAKTSGLSQPSIRPAVHVTSPLSRDLSSPSAAPPRSASAQTSDIAASKSEFVQAVVAELRDMMSEHYSNIRKDLVALKEDLLRDFSKLKSDVVTLQNTMVGVERSLSACSDDVSVLQASVISLTKTVTDLEIKCEDLESRSRRQNIRIIGVPEDGSFALSTSAVSTLLKDALQLPDLPRIDRAHRSLAPKPSPGQPPRPIVARLHYYEDCVTILKQARLQPRKSFSGMTLSVYPDFTAKVAKARAAFNGVRNTLRSMDGVRYGLLYPARLRVTANGEHHVFTSPEEAEKFVRGLLPS